MQRRLCRKRLRMRIKRGTNGGLIIPPLAKRHLMWKKQLEMKHEPFAACSEAHQLARNFLYCSLWDIALKVFYTLQYIYDLILTRTQTVWWFVIFSCCVFFFFFLVSQVLKKHTLRILQWNLWSGGRFVALKQNLLSSILPPKILKLFVDTPKWSVLSK